jgi:hypothetical protein
MNKNETMEEFSNCVQFLLPVNQTFGGLGCSFLQKSERLRMERGLMVWVTVAALVSGFLLS